MAKIDRVLIVDDDPGFARAIQRILEKDLRLSTIVVDSQEDLAHLFESSQNEDTFARWYAAHRFDLAFIDLSLSKADSEQILHLQNTTASPEDLARDLTDVGGFALIRNIAQWNAATREYNVRCVAWTKYPDKIFASAVLQAGAYWYLVKYDWPIVLLMKKLQKNGAYATDIHLQHNAIAKGTFKGFTGQQVFRPDVSYIEMRDIIARAEEDRASEEWSRTRPEQLRTLMLRGDRKRFDGWHPREPAVIAVDIRGSTPVYKQCLAVPDRVRAVFHPILSHAADVVEREDGAVEGYQGDGMVAFFNFFEATRSHEELFSCLAVLASELPSELDAVRKRTGIRKVNLPPGVGIKLGVCFPPEGFLWFGPIGRVHHRYQYGAISLFLPALQRAMSRLDEQDMEPELAEELGEQECVALLVAETDDPRASGWFEAAERVGFRCLTSRGLKGKGLDEGDFTFTPMILEGSP